MTGSFGVGYIVGQRYGDPLLGVAASFTLALVFVVFPGYLLLCLNTVAISLRDWLAQMYRPALAALGMGLAVLGVKYALYAASGSLSVLAASWLAPWQCRPDCPLFWRLVFNRDTILLAGEITVGVLVYLLLARNEIRWLVGLRRESAPATPCLDQPATE